MVYNIPMDFKTLTDHWARLGVSAEAIQLCLASEIFDLHIDSFIWNRIFGYNLQREHSPKRLGAWFLNQVDIPRLRAAHVTGAMWSITTNPARFAGGRLRAFHKNLDAIVAELGKSPQDVAVVGNYRQHQAARAHGLHAAWIAVQGGNAFEADPDALRKIPRRLLTRVTLVHLNNNRLGVTNSPLAGWRKAAGLTQLGQALIRVLDEERILVDLAHINEAGFWDAVREHDPALPLIVTHTGIASVTPHWRNIDDRQIKAIADTGGTVGIMYQSSFLGDPSYAGKADSVIRHMEQVIRVAGEEFVSLGSDWDGAIIPPKDMPTCTELPVLVQRMLEHKWGDDRIRKVLGGNALRVLQLIRP